MRVLKRLAESVSFLFLDCKVQGQRKQIEARRPMSLFLFCFFFFSVKAFDLCGRDVNREVS